MDDTLVVAISAIIASVAAITKQMYDIREVKKWICYKHPCEFRDSTTPKFNEGK